MATKKSENEEDGVAARLALTRDGTHSKLTFDDISVKSRKDGFMVVTLKNDDGDKAVFEIERKRLKELVSFKMLAGI